MKSTLGFLTALTTLLVSCSDTVNFGYPSTMMFDKNGGTRICYGKSSCYFVNINDNNGKGSATQSKGENDTIIAKYEWLTVKYLNSQGAQLKMIASPNTTGKIRTLYVTGMVNDAAADIKVTQY